MSDFVELVIAIEEGFGIQISDAAASSVVTVGDLHDLVAGSLGEPDTERCLTSAAFYSTRRAIAAASRIDRRLVRPSSSLREFLPSGDRREVWARIQEELKLMLPPLEHTRAAKLFILASALVVVLVPAIYLRVALTWYPLLLLLGLIVGALFLKLLQGWATEFPRLCLTVGDLAKSVLAANHAQFVRDAGGVNRKELWETLCRIVVVETGVAREKIYRETRILADLGIG